MGGEGETVEKYPKYFLDDIILWEKFCFFWDRKKCQNLVFLNAFDVCWERVGGGGGGEGGGGGVREAGCRKCMKTQIYSHLTLFLIFWCLSVRNCLKLLITF